MGLALEEESLWLAMDGVEWIGRLQRMDARRNDEPWVFLDGSHNPGGIAATLESLREFRATRGRGARLYACIRPWRTRISSLSRP